MKKYLMLVVIVLTLFGNPRTVRAMELDSQYKDFVKASSSIMNLDEYVVQALIEKESGNNPNAVNGDRTCFGLCQLHKCWKSKASKAGYGDITVNPESNIAWACYLLAGYVQEYDGDYNRALVRYNAGYLYADESSYSRDILDRAEKIKAQEEYDYKASLYEPYH